MDKRKMRRGGFYWHNREPYVSVTNVLKIIDKPALRYWFGKEVYWAVIKDPSLNVKDALSAPYKTSGQAKKRGTTVHSIVEGFKQTGDIVTDVLPAFKGYAQAFEQWVKEYQATVMEHEKTIINDEHKYAGTLDMLITQDGGTAIIDVKTGKDIYPESGLQLSAYLHGDNVKADKIGVLLLTEKGNYKFQWMEDEFDAFLHAKALWEWNNKEDLLKVNYKGGQHGNR